MQLVALRISSSGLHGKLLAGYELLRSFSTGDRCVFVKDAGDCWVTKFLCVSWNAASALLFEVILAVAYDEWRWLPVPTDLVVHAELCDKLADVGQVDAGSCVLPPLHSRYRSSAQCPFIWHDVNGSIEVLLADTIKQLKGGIDSCSFEGRRVCGDLQHCGIMDIAAGVLRSNNECNGVGFGGE